MPFRYSRLFSTHYAGWLFLSLLIDLAISLSLIFRLPRTGLTLLHFSLAPFLAPFENFDPTGLAPYRFWYFRGFQTSSWLR